MKRFTSRKEYSGQGGVGQQQQESQVCEWDNGFKAEARG